MAFWVLDYPFTEVQRVHMQDAACVLMPWQPMPDLSLQTQWEVENIIRESYSEEAPETLRIIREQVWNFLQLQPEDLIAIPFGQQVRVGEVTRAYHYNPATTNDLRHAVTVVWKPHPLPRTGFEREIALPLGGSPKFFELEGKELLGSLRAKISGGVTKRIMTQKFIMIIVVIFQCVLMLMTFLRNMYNW